MKSGNSKIQDDLLYYREYIKDLIVNARRKDDITQTQLAKLIGVSQSKISKFENGTLEFSASELFVCCGALNIRLSTKTVLR